MIVYKITNNIDGKIMFKNSKPMSGRALEILNYTSTRLMSKTPTSLRKNPIENKESVKGLQGVI